MVMTVRQPVWSSAIQAKDVLFEVGAQLRDAPGPLRQILNAAAPGPIQAKYHVYVLLPGLPGPAQLYGIESPENAMDLAESGRTCRHGLLACRSLPVGWQPARSPRHRKSEAANQSDKATISAKCAPPGIEPEPHQPA